ncbi:MAG: cupin domain-containing protein [Opitutae bacterium]|nr:cupin domain-containing protein [Opitutae bacterium]
MQDIIDRLQLAPLPHEGGWFRQYYLSPECDAAGRPCASAIHFLMTPEGFSALHRLHTPETWRWCEGAAAELLMLAPDGTGRLVALGPDEARGQVPEATVPGGVWQGARPLGAWTLVDCTMAPAWDEREFELGDRARLTAAHPAWAEHVRRLTRGSGRGV